VDQGGGVQRRRAAASQLRMRHAPQLLVERCEGLADERVVVFHGSRRWQVTPV